MGFLRSSHKQDSRKLRQWCSFATVRLIRYVRYGGERGERRSHYEAQLLLLFLDLAQAIERKGKEHVYKRAGRSERGTVCPGQRHQHLLRRGWPRGATTSPPWGSSLDQPRMGRTSLGLRLPHADIRRTLPRHRARDARVRQDDPPRRRLD